MDFAGETGFTAHLHSSALLVQGCGAQVGDSVRFHEKGGGPGGKDVRVWDVGTDGATFVASPAVAF